MDSVFLARLGWLAPAPRDFGAHLEAALAESSGSGGLLRRLAMSAMSEAQLTRLGRALDKARAAGTEWPELTPFRLAILCNGTSEHLAAPLSGSAVRYGVDLDVMAFSYHDSYVAAVGGDGRLRDFAPDAVLIAMDYRALPAREQLRDPEGERRTVEECARYLQALYDGVRSIPAACIAQTLASPPSSLFGHAGGKTAGSLHRILNEVNRYIYGPGTREEDVLFDVAVLAETVGTSSWFDSRLWHVAKIPFAMSLVPLYADHVGRIVGAMRGKSRRVLVMDLDNTLWGGGVGDDGVEGIAIGDGSPAGEAFLDFQPNVLALRQRGVLLAVASKNDETQARRPFREIPDMVLEENSFSVFRANWNDKATNIEEMALELDLGLDSFVFVDDNPAERALVRRFLPEVAVLEMPEDPSDYAAALDASGHFESVSFSEEDARRADLYRNRQAMTGLPPRDLFDYLASLEMQLIIERVHSANRARVVQLVNKSNQFNLTTRRFTAAEVEEIEGSDEWEAFALRLTDRLDDHGIVSVIFCEKRRSVMDVVLWVMSCRAIGRNVEQAALRLLIEVAKTGGCEVINGSYLPTSRNKLVENHYATLGFRPVERAADGSSAWALRIGTEQVQPIPMELVDHTAEPIEG